MKQTIFNEFTFFLEILLSSGSYLTIRRGVTGRANTALKQHGHSEDLTGMKDEDFDFVGGDEKALQEVNKILNFSINEKKINNFRRYLGYFLRKR